MAFTDHKPLTFASAKVSDPWSACKQHQQTAMSEYIIAGKCNLMADALSRPVIAVVLSPAVRIDYTALAAEQLTDEKIPAYRTAITGMVLEDMPLGPSDAFILCDVSTG